MRGHESAQGLVVLVVDKAYFAAAEVAGFSYDLLHNTGWLIYNTDSLKWNIFDSDFFITGRFLLLYGWHFFG